jgi:hypothetical protein
MGDDTNRYNDAGGRIMDELQEFKDYVARVVYGQTKTEAQSEGLCISCKKPALERCYSNAGRAEYRISGMCELCFDDICEPDGEYDYEDDDDEEAF